jgi:hypothetical protein
MRLFDRNGTHILIILAKSVYYQIGIWKVPHFQFEHCHTGCRGLFVCWQDCLSLFDGPIYANPRHMRNIMSSGARAVLSTLLGPIGFLILLAALGAFFFFCERKFNGLNLFLIIR